MDVALTETNSLNVIGEEVEMNFFSLFIILNLLSNKSFKTNLIIDLMGVIE